MSNEVEPHQQHAHRYATLHHSTELDVDEPMVVPREQATKCQHKFSRAADSYSGPARTTQSQADLIAHLEKQSEDWVVSFTSEINGQSHGLRQKFALHLKSALGEKARADEHSGISIVERYGT